MTDIFLSYARQDRPRAQRLAEGLEEAGFTVWWDRQIPPGKSFDEVIHEALEAAKCVVVIWSETSVRSDWVKEEAQRGGDRGVLVPVLMDDVPSPLGFGRLQAANLADWGGDVSRTEFRNLVGSISEIVGRDVPSIPEAERRAPRAAPGTTPASGGLRGQRLVVVSGIAIALAIVVAIAAYLSRGPAADEPEPAGQEAAPSEPAEPPTATVAAEAKRPPVEFHVTPSTVIALGGGWIIWIRNASEEDLTDIRVKVSSPDGESRSDERSRLAPGATFNVGRKKLEGWPIYSGFTVEVRAAGFADAARYQVPYP